ncbi:MAG: SoxR reducing system RseC family protein [Thermodesulfobacteriota bacterium]
MAMEEGIVVAVENNNAKVRTRQSATCEACASRSSCNAMGGGNDMEVEALNTVGARVGDTVILKIEAAPLFKVTFLLYVFPVLCLFMGAVIGQELAPLLSWNNSLVSAGMGFLFFIIAMVFVRRMANRLAGRAEYKPVILRIKHSLACKPME